MIDFLNEPYATEIEEGDELGDILFTGDKLDFEDKLSHIESEDKAKFWIIISKMRIFDNRNNYDWDETD